MIKQEKHYRLRRLVLTATSRPKYAKTAETADKITEWWDKFLALIDIDDAECDVLERTGAIRDRDVGIRRMANRETRWTIQRIRNLRCHPLGKKVEPLMPKKDNAQDDQLV